MKKNRSKKEKANELRRRAEAALTKKKVTDIRKLSDHEVKELIHELQVHKIELEMQNEELRRTQTEAEEARDKYTDLYDFSPVAYLTLDEAGTVLEANPAASSLFKKEKLYIIKRKFPLFVASDQREAFYAFLKQTFATSAKQACELKLFTSDARPFYALLEGARMESAQKGLRLCQIAVIDITKRKQAQEATLEDSEAKFKTIFENAGGAIFIADAKTGELLECNLQAEQLVGRSRDEIIGMHQSKLHPDREAEKYKEVFRSHIENKHTVDFESEVQHKDGRRIPVGISAQTFKMFGKDVVMGFFIDITKRKKLEEELRESYAELESRVQARTAELSRANEELQSEITKRGQVEEELKARMQDFERFSKIAVDRELKMEELEKKVRELEERLKAR